MLEEITGDSLLDFARGYGYHWGLDLDEGNLEETESYVRLLIGYESDIGDITEQFYELAADVEAAVFGKSVRHSDGEFSHFLQLEK